MSRYCCPSKKLEQPPVANKDRLKSTILPCYLLDLFFREYHNQ